MARTVICSYGLPLGFSKATAKADHSSLADFDREINLFM